jgi:hypothetical protein
MLVLTSPSLCVSLSVCDVLLLSLVDAGAEEQGGRAHTHQRVQPTTQGTQDTDHILYIIEYIYIYI